MAKSIGKFIQYLTDGHIHSSTTLPIKIPDIGLLKVSWVLLSYFKPLRGALTQRCLIIITFLTLRGSANIYFTWPNININFIFFNNPYKQQFTWKCNWSEILILYWSVKKYSKKYEFKSSHLCNSNSSYVFTIACSSIS